jgi:hypothetical protein
MSDQSKSPLPSAWHGSSVQHNLLGKVNCASYTKYCSTLAASLADWSQAAAVLCMMLGGEPVLLTAILQLVAQLRVC